MNGVRAQEKTRFLAKAAQFISVPADWGLQLLSGNRVLRATAITVWYMTVVSLAYYGAFLLRFDGAIPAQTLEVFYRTLPVLVLLRILTFQRFELYSGLLHYVSVDDVWRTMKAVAISTLCFMVIVYLMQPGFAGFPRSVFIIETMLTLGLLAGHRMSLRALRERSLKGKAAQGHSRRTLIVGDLDSADDLLRVMQTARNEEKRFVGIVHDSPGAYGKKLRGVKVVGGIEELPDIVERERPGEVLILPPYTSSPNSLRQVIDRCTLDGNHSCKYQMVPSLLDIADGKTSVSMIRQVEIEDLLGRPPVKMDRSEVKDFLKGKSVLVTGAGGSIGSELCRQIGNYEPRLLVLYEMNEYNLYEIDLDLRKRYPGLAVVPVAGDICDERSVARTLERYGTEVIYHAAAYKHVPLMEHNVSACVRTNVLGTDRVAAAAERFGVKKFVLISSDKAVRPTSIMGATKRLAERLIQERPPSKTKFVAVRFGNVLGSSGSVIPLFKRQIKAGGPVTVTHREINRYFMSIPEAVDLVLQAAIVGDDREIMVLEMGEPIKIRDLAARLIELSGMRPGKDIEIRFTGLRPGEKLYEELLTADDNVVRTAYEKIWVLRADENGGALTRLDLDALEGAVEVDDVDTLRSLVAKWIPENHLNTRHAASATDQTASPALLH